MNEIDDGSERGDEGSGYRKTIGYRLQHAARLHRSAIARALSAHGLYPGQEQVLKQLSERGQESVGSLAAALHVRPPTISKTIARLAAQGLVERRDQADDARVVMVALTEAGQAKAKAIDAIWFEVEEQMLAALDPKDRRKLRKTLRRLEKSLGEDGGDIDEAGDGE